MGDQTGKKYKVKTRHCGAGLSEVLAHANVSGDAPPSSSSGSSSLPLPSQCHLLVVWRNGSSSGCSHRGHVNDLERYIGTQKQYAVCGRTYIRTDKFSIEHNSVGLAHTHPTTSSSKENKEPLSREDLVEGTQLFLTMRNKSHPVTSQKALSEVHELDGHFKNECWS